MLRTCQKSSLAEVTSATTHAKHKHLRRLPRIWIDSPIYFVTTCTKNRCTILARDGAAQILIAEWRTARERQGWAVGRYVIMPDHVHFFCRPELDAKACLNLLAHGKVGQAAR